MKSVKDIIDSMTDFEIEQARNSLLEFHQVAERVKKRQIRDGLLIEKDGKLIETEKALRLQEERKKATPKINKRRKQNV
jgi:hypothetical protein